MTSRQEPHIRDVEVPSGGVVGSARGIAHFAALQMAASNSVLQDPDLLAAPPVPPASGIFDDFFRGDVRFSLGFMKPGSILQFGYRCAIVWRARIRDRLAR
jgi:hypothetical protein